MERLLLPDGYVLEAPAASPLGIMIGLLAQLPPDQAPVVRFEGGDPSRKTAKIAEALASILERVAFAGGQIYHLMATVGRQQGINYGEPIMLCYLKPVFASESASPWLIKTSAAGEETRATLVLNRQRASSDLAEAVSTREHPFELVDPAELEALTGMLPGAVNFLMEAHRYHSSFLACYFQPELLQLRPGETEYLGVSPDSSLDLTIVEVPLGLAGEHYSVLIDGSTFFWILTEIQKQFPQIKFLQGATLGAEVLRLSLWQMGESLSQGLKRFKLGEHVPVFSYFSSLERYLEKHIHSAHPYLHRDTITIFVREFVRNFFAVEGKTLYAMIDTAICEGIDSEDRLREILYLFYRQFARTEFATMLTSLHFDLFLQKLCADLLDLGIVNEFTLATLLEQERFHKAIEKQLPGRQRLKDIGDIADGSSFARSVLQTIKQNPSLSRQKTYTPYEFSDETAKSEKYFVLHAQIVDLLPHFVIRNTRESLHPLVALEKIQADMISFFSRRSRDLGISHTTISNVVKSLIRIIFGKHILLLDVIEDRLEDFSLSFQVRAEPGALIAPALARVHHQASYAVLRERRKQWSTYLLEGIARVAAQEGKTYQERVFEVIRPDLENFLNLPLMRAVFGSSSALYRRLIGAPPVRAVE